jgi:hypothetical protein
MRREALEMSGVPSPTPLQNRRDAAAGTGGLDDRGRVVGGRTELLGHVAGERVDGAGADDADLVAGLCHTDNAHDGGGDYGGLENSGS